MRHWRITTLAAILVLLAACVPIPPAATVPAPTQQSRAPHAVEYNLGDATITQARFPEDSRFRNMPVRLNGIIAAPNESAGPFPVVVILHGTHPGCPVDDQGVDRWPCDPADERPNYRGFGYLAEHLAANGYVALSININAENTFGFGEPTPNERLTQIVDKHLAALALAAAGGENQFGVDLKGKADLHRLAFAGHSRGAEMAYMLAHSPEMAANAAAEDGYGPVAGILMIAAAPVFADPANGSTVPLGIILPMCDADVTNQDGQHFYEGARLAAGQQTWAASAFVESANHNFFNSILGDDPFGRQGRPDCKELLTPQAQQDFLTAYAVDFFAALFGAAPVAEQAKARLGLDPHQPAPSELYGLAGRVATLAPRADRTTLLTPARAEELDINALGGQVTAEGLTTFYCPEGYYTPMMRPGSEPCRRATVVVPGQPAHIIVSWEKPGAALRFELPSGQRYLSRAAALSLRAAVDPLSELNPAGEPQAFSIRVTDGAGKTATLTTRADEPALRFPPGEVTDDATFGPIFTGRVPLTTIRLPLSALQGVDKTDIREIALVFDRTQTGSLFLGDLEWVNQEAHE